VRLAGKKFWLCAVIAVLLSPLMVRAQNPDTIAPEESEARARKVIDQLIQGFGGPAFLGMKERQCEGRRALMGHDGSLTGYVQFKDAWQFPDKNRTDFFAKSRNTLLGYIVGVQELDLSHGGLVITTFNGEQGWTMDRGGVSDMPEDTLAEFQAAVQRNPDNLLRLGLKNPELSFRWAGLDTVDLHEVDWVEIYDREDHVFRLAVDRMTHLLVRSVFLIKDVNAGEQHEDVSIFTNYLPKSGVQIPMQITRERDGRRIAQIFNETCEINPQLAADYFTREALVQRYKETGGKKGK
jgi:hypothetical protein